MREHNLYVMTLEEFPPNREFVGRNFNAGEVIQLVLKSPSSGRWLPFEYVQMVMMHELAHCKQMNHSRAFWAVRNSYAASMRVLWGKGYTGDGLWGRGKGLGTGMWERDTVREGELLPEHTCGGTFRSRGRKRGRKPVVSYQERKQRRIEKKFGKHGVSLGADESTKVKLENGKKVKGKPRVAGSARGRELRAAAALARFETQKVEEKLPIKDEDESDSGSDYEDSDFPDLESKDAVDFNGERILDGKGRGMVKVCEDEEGADPEAQDEMAELRDVFARVKPDPEDELRGLAEIPEASVNQATTGVKPEFDDSFERWADGDTSGVKAERFRSTREMTDIPQAPPETSRSRILGNEDSTASEASELEEPSGKMPGEGLAASRPDAGTGSMCSMCSFANPSTAVTCSMCANVLDPARVRGAWRCSAGECANTSYHNARDCDICGLCGARKGNLPT